MTQTKPRLALVEDYQDLRNELLSLLTSRGYPCWGVGSAEAFYKELSHHEADIVLIDLGLPGEDGFSLVDHLHQHSQRGLMIITARANREDRLAGLRAGADDYLVKPVDPDELYLRIDNLWQRLRQDRPTPAPAPLPWTLDPARQAILGPQGECLILSQQEFLLLTALADQPNQIHSKQDLHERLFPDASAIDTHRIDVILNRIRKKTQDAGLLLPIRAVFGRGLTFLG